MSLLLLVFAGVMFWFAKLQNHRPPRVMMKSVAVGAIFYALWLFYADPQRAWEIWWVGRAILRTALRIIDFLIP